MRDRIGAKVLRLLLSGEQPLEASDVAVEVVVGGGALAGPCLPVSVDVYERGEGREDVSGDASWSLQCHQDSPSSLSLAPRFLEAPLTPTAAS